MTQLGFWKAADKKGKQVLVMGSSGCGRRAFLSYYKDAAFDKSHKSLFKIMEIREHLNSKGEKIDIAFTLDHSAEGFSHHPSPKTHYDLIVILADLSSSTYKSDMEYHKKFAQIHFKGINCLIVCTKADIKKEGNDTYNLILTSAKTGEGFDEFRNTLHSTLMDEAHDVELNSIRP